MADARGVCPDPAADHADFESSKSFRCWNRQLVGWDRFTIGDRMVVDIDHS